MDSDTRHALVRDLRGVAVGWRFAGLASLAVGGAVMLTHPEQRHAWIGLVVAGFMACVVAIARRTAFRRRWLDERGVD